MKRILTTVAAALIAGQAGAATLTPLSGFGDSDFVALCGEGGNNEACERGVAEIRGGNGRPNGDLEFTVREGFVQDVIEAMTMDPSWSCSVTPSKVR